MPRIQVRRGTAAAWTSADPTLAEGEIGLETDTRKVKYGDGVTAWTSLAYPTGGTGAPDDATYLTKTAHAALSNEEVVGATPGGELGGTWASPTVDATHSGSTHAATQAAAEATAAAALATHAGAADPHTGYRLESADHSHASTGLQGGKIAQSASHESPDTDVGPTSLHHTIGSGANQAAAGNHSHTDPTAGAVAFPADSTSTATGDIIALDLTGVTIWRWNGASAANLCGIAGGADGRVVFVMNVTTAQTLTVKHQSTTDGTAGNRIICPDAGDSVLGPGSGFLLEYDATTSRWRVVQEATYSSVAAAVGTASAGTAGTTPARGDHVHPTGAGTPSTQAFGDAAAVGTGPAAAMTDHKHAMPTGSAGPDADITVDGAGAAGTANTAARSGHGHKLITSASAAVALGVAAAGTSGHAPSRDDHVHPTTGLALDPHGAAQHNDVTRSIFIPARGFSGTSFTAADTGTASTRGTVPDAALVGSLADAATQGHLFMWALPTDAKAATACSIRIAWRPNSTDAVAHTVRWSVDAKALNAGATVTGAGTTTTFTGASAARTADVMVIDTSTQILASTSADDILRIDVRRVGADAADTYVGVVDIVGIFVDYTAVE